MAWYRTGTVTASAGSTTLTGTGTKWNDNKVGIGVGQMLLIPGSGTVQVFEISKVNSDTELLLQEAPAADITGSAYAILAFYGNSYPDFARQLAAQLKYYQSQMDGWQEIMTGDGSVTLTAPDGTSVTISSFKKLTEDIADKASSGSNSDITEIKGLTTALSIEQGGTGKTKAEDAITALGGLPASGGTMKGALSWISTAVLQSSLGNLGFTAIDTNGPQSSITVNTSIGAFTIKFGSVVVTANAAGEGTVSYPVAFSSKVDTVLVTDGDNAVNSVDGNIYIINFNGTRTAGFDYHAVNRANAIMRINFIAIGR